MKDDFSGQFIQSTINRFYSLISDDVSAEGSPNSRYKSWEWCHRAFLEGKDRYSKLSEKEKSDVVDYLSLHLGFYLASWGMYRGSSFLLQRDYKTHKSVVEEILKDDYDILWDFSPSENINDKAVKGCCYYYKIANDTVTIENGVQVPMADYYEFPEDLKSLIKECQRGIYGSKESCVVLTSNKVIRSILLTQKDNKKNKISLEDLIGAIFDKMINSDLLDQCDISIRELRIMKKTYIEEKLYYDFLR